MAPWFFQRLRLESNIEDLRRVTPWQSLCWALKHVAPWQPDGPVDYSSHAIPEDFRTDLRIVSVGDLMYMGRDYDLRGFLPVWRERFGDALKIGNLEVPLALSQPPSSIRALIRFNASATFWEQLRAMGFDVLSVANNHSLDMGAEGLAETCERLRDAGTVPIGTTLAPEISIERNGRRIGFLAYTYGTNREPQHPAVHRFPFYRSDVDERKDEIIERIRALGARHDLVVLALHWGHECETAPDSLVRRLAGEFVEAGVDLLLGHHPHVPQPAETLRRRDGGEALILYSQGNFLSRSLHPLMRTGHVFDIRVAFEGNGPRMAFAAHKVFTRLGSLRTCFVG